MRRLESIGTFPRRPISVLANRRAPARARDQAESGGYGTSSEYVRELIRRDQDRLQLRSLLLAGAKSRVAGEADAAYFAKLRSRVAKKPRARKATG